MSALVDGRRTGRVIGALFVVQMALAPIVNFVLMRRINGPGGFLANAAAHASAVGAAILSLLAIGALSVAIAIVFAPVIRPQSRPPTIWLMAISILTLALAAVESVAIFQMAAVSKAYAATASPAVFEPMRASLVSLRNGAHFLTLMTSAAFLAVFYASSLRFRLLPSALALFGIFAALLQFAAVVPTLFGGKVTLGLIAPIGLAQLALIAWLLLKGMRMPD